MRRNPAAERWLPVPDWPGYEVSDLGRVRSVARVLPDGRTCGGVVLTPRVNRDGYLTVNLSAGPRRRTALVHRLVLTAFRPGGARRWPQVRHRNGDRQDASLSNLLWGDQSLNEGDKGVRRTRTKDEDGGDRKEREGGGKKGTGRNRKQVIGHHSLLRTCCR